MTTAIVFSEEVASGGVNYSFRLRGNIFAPDIDELGCKLQEIAGDSRPRRKSIVLDLTRADTSLFKPRRFFGVCRYLADQISGKGLDIRVGIHITKDHQQLLPDLGQLSPFEVVVEEAKQDKKLYVTAEQSSADPSRNVAGRTILYRFAASVMIVCCALFVLSFISFTNTLLGFALSFSSGILFFEALIVVIALNRRQKK